MADNFHIEIKADNTEEAKEELQNSAYKALTAVGIQISSAAKEELQKSPMRIDTGLLRNSITYAMDGETTAISGYSADRPSKYMNDNSVWSILQAARPTTGTYSGTMPEEPDGKIAVYIGTNVNYAVYVHEGAASGFLKKLFGKNDRMEPNRFLKNAVENNKDDIEGIIKQELT